MSFGLGLDGRFGFQIGVAGAVTENFHALLQVVVAEHIREGGVHARLVGHFGIVGAAFVNDLQRHAVLDGLAHGVFVDVVAKDPLGLVDGRAGVADPGRIGDSLVQIGAEHGVLGAVRLVGHHQNVRAGVQLRKGLGQIRLAELVDHGHHQIRRIRAQAVPSGCGCCRPP